MNLPIDPDEVVSRLIEFQATVRSLVVKSRTSVADRSLVTRTTSADTIYGIDAEVEPLLEAFCREWSRAVPLVLIAEGIESEAGIEGVKVFPEGTNEEDALIRLLVDPIDGTRGLMYDKRAAWALAAVAPNRGPKTRLRDAQVSVMTELPTAKMGYADVLWAIKGREAHGRRMELRTGMETELPLRPSSATNINHGFATISNFFPGTKVAASELMEHLARQLIGEADVTRATVFDDQYISTGGQFYELIVGHDRFNADLRPVFYGRLGQPEGLCCHPYDCAGLLIAEEAGVMITNLAGEPLDGPMDVTSGMSWLGYANETLRRQIAPLVAAFFFASK